MLLSWAVLAGAALLGLASPVRADFTVTFSDGAGNSASFDWDTQQVTAVTGTTNATVGSFASQAVGLNAFQDIPNPGDTEALSVDGLLLGATSTAAGNLFIRIRATTTNSDTPGSAFGARISMGGINLANFTGGAATLTINEQSTGFMLPTDSVLAVKTSGELLASAGVTATYTTQLNGVNVGSVSLPPNSNSPVYTSAANPGNPFTLGGVLVIDMPTNGSVTDISTESLVTPEPASIALLGCGVAGLVGYGWKRRKMAIA